MMTEADRLRLRARVKADEGFRGQLYRDSRGYLTIGYGRLLDPAKGGKIATDEAEYLLANDLRAAERAAEALPAYADLSPPRQAVLVNMCFNMGASKVREFRKMFAALAQQAYYEAAHEILDSLVARQVGARAQRWAWQMRTGEWWTEADARAAD